MSVDVLAIAAHPDDVEQTCGGTLIRMAEMGYRTGVLDLTAGDMGSRGTPEQRVTWAWLHALQRNPSADELKVMTELFAKQLADYKKVPADAEALLKSGLTPEPAGIDKSELAAWTHVARVVLNLHETITRS